MPGDPTAAQFPPDHGALVTRLRLAGCIAAEEEADELWAAATVAGSRQPDAACLAALTARRCGGEPLAWVVGTAPFCGLRVTVHRGVYVPRPQTEPLARLAADCLPADGLAVDLCTGSGAVAMVLARSQPSATVLATELHSAAVSCARANGVTVLDGDLDAPLPSGWDRRVDVVTAVVPYVPTDALRLLPRDVVAHEPLTALDGGIDGLDMLRRVVHAAGRLLRSGGWLFLELGGDQADLLAPALDAAALGVRSVLVDDDGDVRGLAARR